MMKTRIPIKCFLLLFFSVLGLFPSYIYGQEQPRVRVLAYNIHHANPPSNPDSIDLPAIARVIRESKADLVALQEVDVYTQRSGKGLHQAAVLADLTGMYYYFSKSITHQGGEYGNAILSRFPIESAEKIALSAEDGTEPRTLLSVQVSLPGGKKILFASTHLDFSNASNTARQAADITGHFEKATLPIILAGDFNASPGSDAINELDSYFKRSCEENCPPTIPVVNPKRTIDFIFYKAAGSLAVTGHHVIPETYASDHLPVLATFTW
ncbi:endonuclease/exonuclease/phosphatase family protein [Cyclobacterium jeungdonense]|uniref:Endonuclease/exonuclease/phosphatase family protein n=1 Tax=Cyclobacterium jeungdonense TaxID=708087 RepID=A0ABT8C6J3_9BACT|nr:endonuclease/exonuclease/phosphatase family protein [Cyclobacterium jeungdonense]MDN3688369.1 endonuclease/exonuclease/phosphatase family protein [Cyclobacterium jeungdonense]